MCQHAALLLPQQKACEMMLFAWDTVCSSVTPNIFVREIMLHTIVVRLVVVWARQDSRAMAQCDMLERCNLSSTCPCLPQYQVCSYLSS